VDDLAAMLEIMQELRDCNRQDQLDVLRRCMDQSGYTHVERAVEFSNVKMIILDDNQPMIQFEFMYELDRGNAYMNTFYYRVVSGSTLGSFRSDFKD
jgi:hypothetical protein